MLRLHQAYSSVVIGNDTSVVPGGGDTYALNYANASQFEDAAMLLRTGRMNIGQEALMSATVFNFYSPDFAPTGALANNSLVAPELELVTETQIYTAANIYNGLIRNGEIRNNRYTRENGVIAQELLRVRLRDARVREIWDDTAGDETAKATAVAEFLDFYMNAGRLEYLGASPTLTELTIALAASNLGSGEFFELATYGSALLPDFMVQK
jgi:hypothetical protein